MNIETLKDLIASRLSIEEFMDIMGWGMYDLVEVLEEYIEEYQDEFTEAVGE
jgi:hypothetical protein